MIKLEFRREGQLFAVSGASRSGKSLWTAQQVARARRLMVWDLMGEWGTRYRCTRISSLGQLAVAAKSKMHRLAYYRPCMVEDFGGFCRIAWDWLRWAPSVLVIEETSSVTQPGKAPPEYGEIIRTGLRYGVDIYAVTQRWAESDKTTPGNASVIHAGRCNTPGDRRMMAEYLDVPLAEVAALQPLQFIERHASGELVRGRVDPRRAT